MKKLKLQALEFGATELLSRDQLKNVLGGDGSGGTCGSGACTVFNGSSTYSGFCGTWVYGGGSGNPCLCITSLGYYTPSSGGSHCIS